jgi:hypothetical protein
MNIVPGSIKVNEGIEDGRFSFTFPHGTRVQDRILKIRYVVGAVRDQEKVIENLMSTADELVQRDSVDLRRGADPSVVHGVPEAAVTPSPGRNGLLLWLAAGTAVLLAMAVFLMAMLRRKKRAG